MYFEGSLDVNFLLADASIRIFDYNTRRSRINIPSVNPYETFSILPVPGSKFYSGKQRDVTFAVVVGVKNKYCLVLGLAEGGAATFRARALFSAVERTCHYP